MYGRLLLGSIIGFVGQAVVACAELRRISLG